MKPPANLTAAARQHWITVVGTPATSEELAEAADRLCIQLRAGLGRWIGIDGYEAVQARAQALVHARHPALRGHAFGGGDFLASMGAVRAHGAEAVELGLVAWTAAVIDLLGRVVGRRMAMRLVEQSIVPSPRGIADSDVEEPSDDEED